MAIGAPAGYTRVTIAAPECRMDLALPHVATVGELLPQLLRLTGAATGTRGDCWLLGRLGETPLDTGCSVADLDLYDGEILYLTRLREQPPAPVIDDVVDGIGRAASERPGHWRPRYARPVGLALGAGLLSAGAALATAVGGGLAAATAGGLAVLLLVLAGSLSRAAAEPRAGAAFAAAATAFAAAAGFATIRPAGGLGHTGAVQLVLAAAAAVTVAAAGSLAVGSHGPLFAGIAVSATFSGLAGLGALLTGATAPRVAAITIVLTVIAAPFTPTLSLRLAGVTLPTVPGDPRELRDASATDPDTSIPRRTLQADHYLTALLTAGATVLSGCAAVLAFSGGWAARLLCLAIALALPLRARLHPVLAQRLALILGGALSGAFLLAALALQHHGATTLLPIVVLAAAGLSTTVAGLVVPGRRTSPYWGRLLDWLEIACLVGIIPLTAAILGLYSYAHGLAG